MLTPVQGVLGDRFGPRGNWFHSGVDFEAAAGTGGAPRGPGSSPSRAAAAAGTAAPSSIDHGSGVTSWHAHLSRLDVGAGQQVASGSPPAGRASGYATGPHLHFEVRVRGAAIDPLTALG